MVDAEPSPVHLVGFDGSRASRSALRVAARLAAADGADLIVLLVHPPTGPLLLPGTQQAFDEEARRRAGRLLEELGDPAVSLQEVHAVSAAQALTEAAAAHGAAMLTVGATDRGPLGRLAPGSVGERLLHGSPCPVLVVPAGAEERGLSTVGVALEGGRHDDTVLLHAATLASSAGARLVLISVPHVDGGAAFHEEATELERLAADLGGEARVREGRPGPQIVEACDEDVDLLVAGSRAHGPLRAVLAGSVSRHLVDHAPCSVLVVPRPVAIAAERQALTGAGG